MNYAQLIIETEAELYQLEKRQSLAVERDRVRFLKLLKTGHATNQTTAGQAIGLGQRQAQRLWQLYRKTGLPALMMPPSRRGWGKLSSYRMSCLRQFL